MSTLQKWTIVLIVCTGSVCVTCASSIYATTYTQIIDEFNTTRLIATLGLSTFVLGIGTGPLLTGPLSEYYGRRPVYLTSWTFFIIWDILPVVANTMQIIIIARFFQGFAGGTFLSVAGGTVGDLFSPDQIQAPMVLVSLAPFIGPTLGPVLGGFINYYAHWKWTYYFLIIWSVILWILLPRPARKSPITLAILLRPFHLLLFEPMCLCLDLYSAILLGTLYLFFGAFPLVFKATHGMNLWQTGLTFLGIIAGMLLAAASNPVWARIRRRLVNNNSGASEPEYRLPPALCGGVVVPVGLFWFGWTCYPSVHWIVPVVGSAFFGCGMLLVFTGVFTFLVDAYPDYAASALAANGFVRCSLAAAFPLFGNQMYEKLGHQWATSVLAFLALLMTPLPWVFYKYGKWLRGKSRFATAT
ncbi:major facilitator superfamily domain-containing protein [Aspergillus pseudodeflectus]|uniref:Major facilitator superfamily domain-containing protein n=1 Tax=Aspergillus pseudodeflectus TaxID=176178 RepID=A0ABR4JZC0_9EURO